MKKFGFTLAELLVALSIVAVASALMAPAFTSMMPDKYKTRVLKYYSMVANATSSMLDNEAIYPTQSVEMPDGTFANVCHTWNGVVVTRGLECTEQPAIAPYNNDGFDGMVYSGNVKYRNILANMLDLEPSGLNFMTPDGTIWQIDLPEGAGDNWNVKITLTFDSKNGANHSFSASNKNPNQYIFRVNRDGDVSAGDALTDAYLRNPTNRDKKVDKDAASGYLNDPTKNVNYY